MKFAMTHAAKDELLSTSVNAVGELSDAELEDAFGGECGFFFGQRHEQNQSLGLICEVNIFSVSALISNIALLGSVSQICVKG